MVEKNYILNNFFNRNSFKKSQKLETLLVVYCIVTLNTNIAWATDVFYATNTEVVLNIPLKSCVCEYRSV